MWVTQELGQPELALSGWSMDWVHYLMVIHGLGPLGCSMDWVSHGDPLISSVKKVPGLGSSG